MANAFLTAPNTATVAAEIVGADLGIASTLYLDLAAEFNPGGGLTVNVRVPGALSVRSKPITDKTTPIVLDEIAENKIPVTLTDHLYSAVALSEADLNLQLTDFARQVLDVQVAAFGRDIEARAIAAMQTTTATATFGYSAATPAKSFTKARGILRRAGIGAETPLLAAVGSDVYGALLDAPLGQGFDAGSTDKVRGITVAESTRLAPGEVVVYVRQAFALVVRAPAVPVGVSYGASVATEGFALRHLRDYDASVLADRSVVSAFYTVQPMPLATDKSTGTAGVVELVAGAGAVRFTV